MLLKSLEIQGFKTFPDKTVLKFEDPMVAVVGPNGSGKSNVSDAIRWVLGEQSTRALRCSRMEDVIFKGTTDRKAMGYAEVTMNLDNTDRSLNFDGDTVSITRRYYRSGESEYLINKAAVRLKDINELFMDTGLGRDGYSMIGQGKIDSIVSAKSEERREIFEEAAGISRYRYRKEEAERRLERAEDNLVRLRDILAELESRVEPLRIQAEKAEKFIEYDGEKKGLEIGIWVETLNRSGKVLREHEEKLSVAEGQHSEAEALIARLEEAIEENFRATNACTAQMEELRAKAASFDEDATRTEGEILVLKNDAEHAARNVERIRGELAAHADSNRSIEEQIAGKQGEIAQKKEEEARCDREYIRLSEQLEQTRKGTDSVSREIDDILVETARLNAQIAEERVRYSSSDSALNEIRSRGDSLKSLRAETEEKIQRLTGEKEELSRRLQAVEESIQQANNSLSGYELRLTRRREKAEELKARLDRVTLDAGEQNRRAKVLEDLERNLEGFTQSVKTVMRESERGNLRGIHGPVTKILSVPGEYAVAIETALGAAMQNIVVSSEQDAKAAIQLLKRQDSGRATFLPLTTIRGNVMEQREISGGEGFIGIASELVTVKEQYSGIKNSLLGRTVVADTLDNAVRIAKKMGYRCKIVTLDGQVVNAGGSLTGGSLAKNSGLLSRSSEIVRIREKAAQLTAQAEALNQEYKKLQQDIGECEANVRLCRAQLQTAQEEKTETAAEAARAEQELQNARETAEGFSAEQNAASSRTEELNALLQEVYGKINQLEQQAAEYRERSEHLAGSRKQQQELCNGISEQMQQVRLAGFSAQKDREALELSVEALEVQKSSTADLTLRLNNEIAELKRKIEETEGQITALQETCAGYRASAVEERARVEETLHKREELEAKATELRQQERDASSSRENISGEIARLKERQENLQKEYDGIVNRLWEEYELTRREAEEQALPIEDLQKAQRRLTELKNKIKALGAVNVGAVVEYKEVSERYEFLKAQIADVEKSRLELNRLIGELTVKMQEQFSVRFAEINKNFTEIFRELFGGGTASLAFTDESDILNSGIEIKVHPPGKIVSHIEALSGGEIALVAISLYFAIMKVNPPPFCMLDEVEAALDDVNVRRFADYLHHMNQKSQFIVITHRRGTMEEADMLYGVTMQDAGVSKILALKTGEVEEKLGMKST